mmetsp:Transcript_12977/g.18671  ORF Transcript_12977/g.18671 Transcript_12977/m.18671 type:complete len:85 (+) Transcript_12977:26-280(+)
MLPDHAIKAHQPNQQMATDTTTGKPLQTERDTPKDPNHQADTEDQTTTELPNKTGPKTAVDHHNADRGTTPTNATYKKDHQPDQ